MYDIFYVSNDLGDDLDWQKIKSKYSHARRLQHVKSFNDIKSKSFTKMFWVVWDNIVLSDDFDLNSYQATKWDDMYVHVFRNGEHKDGLCLFSKLTEISQKEFNNRFFINKKEIDIIASNPKIYDKFLISSYDDYLTAVQQSKSSMMWCVWDDLDPLDDFKFDYQVPKHNQHIPHVFKNGEHFDGICLLPSSKTFSKKEIDYRFFQEKKEIDIVASSPKKYNQYSPSTYEEYLKINDSMFWLVWPNLHIIDHSVFDLYFSHHNTYDRNENHIFKNRCYDKESYINGLILCSKTKKLSKREFDIKYVIDKKEHDLVATKSRYPLFKIDTYDQYQAAIEQCNDEMFWAKWPEIEITNDSVFDLYFDPRDGKYDYERNINHVFLHHFKPKEYTYNGLMLMSKKSTVGKREIDFRYLINKKEHEEIVSQHRLYDIVFISYEEPNADSNWQDLKTRFPRAKRIHGVKGIHQAHIKAAELSETDMFWVVDGDAIINEDFSFDHVANRYERNIVHVWRSKNPINGLVYGYGGVKLLPRQLTLDMDVNSADMTTSISDQFRAVDAVSNITAFNTDPFNTWKSAFRECVKLSAKLIDRQNDDETNERLEIWCTQGKETSYGEYAIAGAIAGKEFGLSTKNDRSQISKINDFEWLKKQFNGL
jgi:hypothetical protein